MERSAQEPGLRGGQAIQEEPRFDWRREGHGEESRGPYTDVIIMCIRVVIAFDGGRKHDAPDFSSHVTRLSSAFVLSLHELNVLQPQARQGKLITIDPCEIPSVLTFTSKWLTSQVHDCFRIASGTR